MATEKDAATERPPFAEVDQDGRDASVPAGMPPTRTILRSNAPPLSDDPTTAQLKGDIDSGATGDKVGVFDPGLSPLGTDDEAAGTPAQPDATRLARHQERVLRWAGRTLRGTSHTSRDPVLIAFVGAIVGMALVMLIGIAWVR